MNQPQLNALPGEAGWETSYSFDLVVAYEDRETRNRALHLYEHFAQALLHECEIQCSWWKLDHLQEETLLEQAAAAAAEASMVIVSLRAARQVPVALKSWLSRWTGHRPARTGALVALFATATRSQSESNAVQSYLEKVAQETGLDFFPHAFELPPDSRLQNRTDLWTRAHQTTPVLEQILRHAPPVPRWGINE